MLWPGTLTLAVAAWLQTAPPQPDSPPVGSEEIVVTGLRDIEDPDSAVTRQTLSSGRTGSGATVSRKVFAYSQFFARCAMRRSPENLRMLRATLDGRINSASQAYSQIRLAQLNASCLQDPRGKTAAKSDVYDATYYDRGALFVETLRTFAPDLSLTKAQTGNPEVQALFNAREVPLARFRLPVDRRYFEAAICFVRMEPALAVQLVKVERTQSINRLAAAIVNRARPCIGNAERVYFDATQFRFYIADALYRWAVAARGTASLVPDE